MSRYTNTVPAIYDRNGLPIVGAKKFFFKPGSTILKTIYKDVDFIIPQENPVLSDANGRFPDMFLDGIYKEVQQDNSGTPSGFDGVTLWTKDSVGTAPVKGEFQEWNPAITYIITSIVVGSDGNYYKSKIDPNFNNDPISSPLAWTEIQFNEIWNSTTSYFVADRVIGIDGFSYVAKSDNVGKEPSISSEWVHFVFELEAIPGFTTATAHYVNNNTINPFIVTSVMSEDVFEVIGPTGGGATNIWTDLNVIPLSAKYVELYVECTSTDAPALLVRGAVYAREVSSALVGNDVIVLNQALTASGNGANTLTLKTDTIFKVALNSANNFEMAWSTVISGVTTTVLIHIKGFGV